MSQVFKIPLLFLTAVFISLFIQATEIYAKSSVTGRYVSAGGTQIVLSLTIGNPGQSNLIVDQSIGSGNSIISTSPTAQKIDSGRGQIKWLFRNVSPGTLNLSVTLKSPVKERPRATIKFRSPGAGGLQELRISP